MAFKLGQSLNTNPPITGATNQGAVAILPMADYDAVVGNQLEPIPQQMQGNVVYQQNTLLNQPVKPAVGTPLVSDGMPASAPVSNAPTTLAQELSTASQTGDIGLQAGPMPDPNMTAGSLTYPQICAQVQSEIASAKAQGKTVTAQQFANLDAHLKSSGYNFPPVSQCVQTTSPFQNPTVQYVLLAVLAYVVIKKL